MVDTPIIVAYDGSSNADDAVALAVALARRIDAPLALAHVYRASRPDARGGEASMRGREEFMRVQAQALLARGSRDLGLPVRHLTVGASTTAWGVSLLAEQEHAAIVVWGSASDAPPGQVRPGSAARRLLQGGPCAQAFAPVGFSQPGWHTLTAAAAAQDSPDATASRSAETLRLDPSPEESAEEHTLLVLSSSAGSHPGLVTVNAAIDQAIRRARAPVVILASGRPLETSYRQRAVAV